MTTAAEPFWKTKSLQEMTSVEWESLCDGCGRCCLNKLEDEDSGNYYYTNVACKLLDGEKCRCRHYDDRLKHVPDCLVIAPDQLGDMIEFLGGQSSILDAQSWMEKALCGRLDKGDLCLTFDDSLLCQYDVAVPVLRSLGTTGFFFVYSSVFEGHLERLDGDRQGPAAKH